MNDPKTPEETAAAEIAAQQPAKAPKGIAESDINEKVRAGLTRGQAIQVLQAQEAHDAALAAEGKKAKGK